MDLRKAVETFPLKSEEFAQTADFSQYKANQEPLKNAIQSDVPQYKWNIAWRTAIMFLILHLISVYGIWLIITQIKWYTLIFFIAFSSINIIGVTTGAHRLWSHKSYKAKLPLRILLMLVQSAAFQNDIFVWVRDHRVHHKFTDTDADPHNPRRGFFFAHIGWTMLRKHKDVINKGKTIDLSDLKADPVVMFQRRYYAPLVILFCFLIPVSIAPYFWGESWKLSWIVIGFTRYIYVLNCTFFVNSLAHSYGMKPYDKHIVPSENKIASLLTFGEGWHNYHHAFPWDYKTGELWNYRINFTTAFIDLMAILGQAYDLKTATPEMIKKRVQRTGDGSWKEASSSFTSSTAGYDHHIQDDNLWGWDDKDMKPDDVKHVKDFNKIQE